MEIHQILGMKRNLFFSKKKSFKVLIASQLNKKHYVSMVRTKDTHGLMRRQRELKTKNFE